MDETYSKLNSTQKIVVKLFLAIGYRVYRPVPATQPFTLASTTGCRVDRLGLATQPCTLASTYRLQSLLTGCWLHSPYCTVLHPNRLHRKSWLNIVNIDQ